MTPLPRFFSQYFEHADDHRSRRRLQPRNAVAPGSTSHRRPRFRDLRRLLNLVRYFIAVAACQNLADDKLQYHLAGKSSRR
jgi:hypothetical protein